MSVQISAIQLVATKSRLLSMKDRRYDCIILAKEPVSIYRDHDALVPIQLCASILTYRRPKACRLLTSSELQEKRMPYISLHIIILSNHVYNLKPLRLLITISARVAVLHTYARAPRTDHNADMVRPQPLGLFHGLLNTALPNRGTRHLLLQPYLRARTFHIKLFVSCSYSRHLQWLIGRNV